MKSYRITPRARDDLREIGRYSERNWGRAQRNRYLRALENRFAWLAENPRLGKHRGDIREGYYSFPQGGHLVFYLIGRDGIDIIGIPHREMDAGAYID
ncbi:MAG: type II toxin-antitoxin system RelE/ParE family toxin [Gammaproteobacteria bacterium]|nr:type II toxin-antitoxin system RelE/ParE family toxin [Gammaproteobacteria bacterium]MBU1655692.1 type II toxin-antitoxin system RelE/ParE family toxin [Gammaproteobacteria bacterium]MBU1961180.1 type II toxin-antitoxin system RelE/ParE family toxin [Gammaproteobacteria bacterium]